MSMARSKRADVIDLTGGEEDEAPDRISKSVALARSRAASSDEEIRYESSNRKVQGKSSLNSTSKSTPSTRTNGTGRVSEDAETPVANGAFHTTNGGSDANSRSYQLPRGLDSSNGKSRQFTGSRKTINGSPRTNMNQKLLKRARDSQSGSPDPSRAIKKRRIDSDHASRGHPSSPRSKVSRQPVSARDHGDGPVDLRSDRCLAEESPRKKTSQAAQDTASELSRREELRSAGRDDVERDTGGSSIPERSTGRDVDAWQRRARSKGDQADQPGSLHRSTEIEDEASAATAISKGPGTPSHLRTAQGAQRQGREESNERENGEGRGSGVSSVSAAVLKISRRTSSEDDQGYASLGSNQVEDALEILSIDGGAAVDQTTLDRPDTGSNTSETDERRLGARSKKDAHIDDHLTAVPKLTDSTRFRLPGSPKSALAMSNLSLGKQVEMVLGKYLEEFRSDNEHWAKLQLKRARDSADQSSKSPELSSRTSFANMKPLPFTAALKESSGSNTWVVEPLNAAGKPLGGKSFLSAPVSHFSTKGTSDVPDYANYVSIKSNILAPNVTTLHCWPYFGDDMQEDELKLDEQYDCDIIPREHKITQRLKAQQYELYVTKALDDLGCAYEDLLRFLLEEVPDVGRDKDAQSALRYREEFCRDDPIARQADRWKYVLKSLPKSSPLRLARVAVLCENFHKLTKFSIWHVARRNDLCKIPDEELRRDAREDLTCRVCLRFDCPVHGEIRQSPESPETAARECRLQSELAHASTVNTDIINPPKINYRTRIPFPPSVDRTAPTTLRVNRNKHANHWTSGNYTKADERGPFFPCHHPGRTCEDAHCSCFADKIPCEKTCGCAPDCSRKFQGCACSTKIGRRLVCAEDPDCACYQSGRECDPDLCGGCGVCEVVDPVNQGDDSLLHGRCRNASLQRGVDKHTLMGTSDIHGLGLYACETIQENEFVGEYIGEIILKEEADRRGAVYEHQRLSYLFSLNAAQEIDSTYFGNKLRFVNHASSNKANLRARITMVNTTHRIGLYAERVIKAGEELLFDYGPMFPNEQLSGKKPTKSAPHVRNTNLVGQFYEVSTHTDELGNLRARKVTKTTGKKKPGRKPDLTGRAGANAANATSTKRKKPQLNATGKRPNDAESYPQRGAGERLAAFNIAQEAADDAMELDVEDDSDAFVPSDNWGQEESEVSDARFDVEDEFSEPGRRRRRRRQ